MHKNVMSCKTFQMKRYEQAASGHISARSHGEKCSPLNDFWMCRDTFVVVGKFLFGLGFRRISYVQKLSLFSRKC